jgi:hypothetical protein
VEYAAILVTNAFLLVWICNSDLGVCGFAIRNTQKRGLQIPQKSGPDYKSGPTKLYFIVILSDSEGSYKNDKILRYRSE